MTMCPYRNTHCIVEGFSAHVFADIFTSIRLLEAVLA